MQENIATEMRFKLLYFFVLVIAFVQLGCSYASAQMVDSSEYVSILRKLQNREHSGDGNVRIEQSSAITKMLDQNAYYNQRNQSMQGYRIRIYRDNSQSARQRSVQVEQKFKERYPDFNAYRSYNSPYFIVTIGDFRTVDEAIKFQNQMIADYGNEYSNAWISPDKIYFPPIINHE